MAMNKKILKGRNKIMFDVSRKISNPEDWLSYFRKNMNMGLEYELENNNVDDDRLIEKFGMYQTAYHEYMECSDCPERHRCTLRRTGFGCHMLFRDKLIVSIQSDASINGSEFLLHTGNMGTKEFIERLPIQTFKNMGYYASRNGSIHVHLIVPFFKREIPIVILENFWDLFRYYYCGIAYLTGTRRERCLRGSCGRFRDYHKTLEETRTSERREGLNLCETRFDEGIKHVTHLNLEIRVYDNSLNFNHVALCRFISYLLWIRAVEISEYGKYILRNTNEWKAKKNAIRRLNHLDRLNIVGAIDRVKAENEKTINVMKETAEELYVEIEHLMTKQEKEIFREFINEPIWLHRSKVTYTDKKLKRKISEFDKALICLVKTKSVFADSRKQYYKKVAKMLDKKEVYIKNRLSKIKAKWNGEIGAYIIK